MRIEDMWDGDSRSIDPVEVIVQADWEFHNPFSTDHPVMRYAKGDAVVVSLFIPARCNQPFGFPFFWGQDGKPYPAWLIEPAEDQ